MVIAVRDYREWLGPRRRILTLATEPPEPMAPECIGATPLQHLTPVEGGWIPWYNLVVGYEHVWLSGERFPYSQRPEGGVCREATTPERGLSVNRRGPTLRSLRDRGVSGPLSGPRCRFQFNRWADNPGQ